MIEMLSVKVNLLCISIFINLSIRLRYLRHKAAECITSICIVSLFLLFLTTLLEVNLVYILGILARLPTVLLGQYDVLLHLRLLLTLIK